MSETDGDVSEFLPYLARERDRLARFRVAQLSLSVAALGLITGAVGWALPVIVSREPEAIAWIFSVSALFYMSGFRLAARRLVESHTPSRLPEGYNRTQAVALVRFFRRWGASPSIRVRGIVDLLAMVVLAIGFWFLGLKESGIWFWILIFGAVNFSISAVRNLLVSRIRPSALAKIMGRYSAGLFVVREELSADDVQDDPLLMELLGLENGERLADVLIATRDRIHAAVNVVNKLGQWAWPLILLLNAILLVYGIEAGYLTDLDEIGILQAATAVLAGAVVLAIGDVAVGVYADRSIAMFSQIEALLAQGEISQRKAKEIFHAVEILRLNGHTYYGHVNDFIQGMALSEDG